MNYKVLVVLLAAGLTVFAAERMVVDQVFTITTAEVCADAEDALDAILADDPTRLAAVHIYVDSGTPLYSREGHQYVGTYVSGTFYVPYGTTDGDTSYCHDFSWWASQANARKDVPSPLKIKLYRHWSPTDGRGKVHARVVNETGSAVTGHLHFMLTETGVQYPAPNGLATHNQVLRDMLPSAYGEGVVIDGHETLNFDRDYTIDPAVWVPDSCELVCFIQSDNWDGPRREIHQGAKIPAVTDDSLAAADHTVYDPSGNNNGRLDAGETVQLTVGLRNDGPNGCSGVRGELYSADDDITITKRTGAYGSIAPGATVANDADRFTVQVSSGVALDRPVKFSLFVTTDEGFCTTLTVMDSLFAPAGVAERVPVRPVPTTLTVTSLNPGRADVDLRYELPTRTTVRLAIYDAAGALIRTLVEAEQDVGCHQTVWDGRERRGRMVPAGVYFGTLELGGAQRLSRKLVIVR